MREGDLGRFVIGVTGGIIVGAVIDNMTLGLLIGFAVGFGMLTLRRRKR